MACACAVSAAVTLGGAGPAFAAQQARVPIIDSGYEADYGLVDDGPSDPSLSVTDDIYLNVRDSAALADEARSVSTPGSQDYGHYSTPQQIQARNQLTPAQLSTVRDWLTSAGLTVTEPNWRTLKVTGTIGQMQDAFGVTFHNYADPDTSDPYRWQIPASDMTVPADVFPLILSPSTNSFPVPVASQSTEHSPNQGSASRQATGTGVNRPARLGGVSYPSTLTSTPTTSNSSASTSSASASSADADCTQYWGQKPATGMPSANGETPPLPPCGYTPDQLRHAYGLDDGNLTGKGQTVAVVTPAMDTLEQDVDTWSKHVGTPQLRPGQLTVVPTPDGSPALTPQDGGIAMVENTLDVEAVHGMAPGANIDSVGLSTANDGTVLDSLIYILDHTPATIVSLSLAFDAPPGLQQALDAVYQEGALQGVGFYYASGDGGHDPTTGSYLNPQAGDDWATGVGGTSLGIGPGDSREWETGWGDSASELSSDGASWGQPANGGGAGGGWMAGQPEPWYQKGVVSDAEATGPDGKLDRVGPDVAMDADATTGMLIGGTPVAALTGADPSTWTYAETRAGGTSQSTPLFAGVQALAQQARGGKPIGFANPLLYSVAGAGAFRDIVQLPGTAPDTVVQHEVALNTWAWFLTQMVGKMPVSPPSALTPQVGPGFDTETGLGVPTGNYLSMMKRKG